MLCRFVGLVRQQRVLQALSISSLKSEQILIVFYLSKDKVDIDKVQNQNKKDIAEIRSNYQEEEKSRTEQETANYRNHVDVHQESYKRAQKGVATGMLFLSNSSPSHLVNFPNLVRLESHRPRRCDQAYKYLAGSDLYGSRCATMGYVCCWSPVTGGR